ncbi:hypothetical protein QYF36_010481 [Acer negundo]|nr:hypothetical protein QYF36_010481 [Acer negundo]
MSRNRRRMEEEEDSMIEEDNFTMMCPEDAEFQKPKIIHYEVVTGALREVEEASYTTSGALLLKLLYSKSYWIGIGPFLEASKSYWIGSNGNLYLKQKLGKLWFSSRFYD